MADKQNKVIMMPVQTFSGDDSWARRALEKAHEWGIMKPATEHEADRQAAAAHLAHIATPSGSAANVASQVFGPMAAGIAPSSRLASAVVGGGVGALNGYAQDGTMGSTLQGAVMGAGAGALGASLAPGAAAREVVKSAGRAAKPVPAPVTPPTPVKGGWDPAKIEQVLGNATARRAMQGKPVEISEKALERLLAARAASQGAQPRATP